MALLDFFVWKMLNLLRKTNKECIKMGVNRDTIGDMIKDLVVIDFQSDDLPQQISKWKRDTLAPFAQNCRRNLYYGFEEDFDEFPHDKLDRDYTSLGGSHAYAHIMQFASGFERGQYNSHNRHQFFDAWATSIKNYSETGEKYGKLLSFINSDTNFMHQHITSKYKARRLEISARDMSGMTKGDDVLIIGSLDRKSDLSPLTSGMIRMAESKQKGRKGFISLTHPDPDVLEAMHEALKGHEDRGNIRSGVQIVDFDDFALAAEISDHVYVTMPMAEDHEADLAIIDTWKNRSNTENSLTHFQGVFMKQGSMSSLWEDAHLDNFVSPLDLRDDMKERATYNAEVIVKAEQAFWQCAELRSQGLPIHKEDFFGRSPDLLME
tara:strand:- start:11642 stop:12778 length:1137 start_codon:yes stop_codon:yes gene_type:complete